MSPHELQRQTFRAIAALHTKLRDAERRRDHLQRELVAELERSVQNSRRSLRAFRLLFLLNLVSLTCAVLQVLA